MEQFQFQLDQKVSVWYRTKFNVEGNTLEEAKENLKKLIQDKKLDEVTSGIPWELIDDTTEILSPSDNGGYSTEDIFCSHDLEVIHENGESNY
jgi:hypothetical protein